jgi:hypothetical protein
VRRLQRIAAPVEAESTTTPLFGTLKTPQKAKRMFMKH